MTENMHANTHSNTHAKRILFVEDHPDTLAMMKFGLETKGFLVTAVGTLAEAWAESQNSEYDLYLLNHVFPDGSGITLCREIRKIDPHTPVIFFSARAMPQEQQMGLEAGANAYITKPADMYFIAEVAERVIAEAKEQRQ